MDLNGLSYDSLKTVLKHMEANRRFDMARRLPSIRVAEKAAPLHIRRLEFDTDSINVNGMIYRATLFETFPSGARREIEESIDEHGFKVDPNSVVFPGDVRMMDWNEPGAMQQRKMKDVRNLRLQLYVYNSPPWIYDVPFTTKKFEVIKRLSDMFFGNRKAEWKVTTLCPPSGIMRWPLKGMKPKVHQISIHSEFLMDALPLIVDPSSFPMNIVRFSCGALAEDLNHPTVTNAKELRFGHVISRELLLQLRHPKVSVMGEVPAADLNACVNQWMRERRSIGVHYSIRYDEEPKELLEMISSRPEVLKKSERCVELAMGSTAILKISYLEVKVHLSVWFLDMRVCRRQ
ncbi:hypothetical protein B9Z55_000176 [Caenorhabditis nigoni]|uniref:F-box associated domain-containing protein n=1 Tax=Caenorhabditis nigoni TaxID=1611254 RepID=A0A2G5VHA4_9PELO|nr:hypothetical protein B9Z55_000176 [Caenorhabditis nigoni]